MSFDDLNPPSDQRLGSSGAQLPLIETGRDTGRDASREGSLDHLTARGETLRVEGTNVVRVPFGVRRPLRSKPARPERWATVVLPFQAGGSTPPPPQAA